MAVVASFTHDGSPLLPPSQLVTFTDTSTGSPNNWFWEFGDGEVSNLQHPTHTYVGSAPTTFDVKLTAWNESSKTAQTMSAIFGTARCTEKVVIGSQPPDREAEFTALNSWTTVSSIKNFAGNMTDTNASSTWREIRGIRTQWASTPTSDLSKVPYIQVPLVNGDSWYNRFPGSIRGTVVVKRSDPGTWPGNFGTIFTAPGTPVGTTYKIDISAWRGISSWWMVTSTEAALPGNESNSVEEGFFVNPVQPYNSNTGGANEIDTAGTTLIFGTPPIASFEASPVAGPNGFEVIFNNTSIEAVGLPTTWSWLKRKHNSGDSYVEFSTAKHPTENFGK